MHHITPFCQSTTHIIIPTQNKFFWGYTGITLSVCVWLCQSVYKILVSVRVLAGVFTFSWKILQQFSNNFNFDENGRKSSKRKENTVGKGEIACYDQFFLFPKCLQTSCTADFQLFTTFEKVTYPINALSWVLMSGKKESSRNMVGNGDNGGYQHFLLFQQCFLYYQR